MSNKLQRLINEFVGAAIGRGRRIDGGVPIISNGSYVRGSSTLSPSSEEDEPEEPGDDEKFDVEQRKT